MTKDRIQLVVAVAPVPGWHAPERAPLAEQRATARMCRALLQDEIGGLPDSHMSVSHSRAWVAVAAARAGRVPKIGVDVEYAEPARDWSRIVAYLASRRAGRQIAAGHGAMIWTSYEAVFKATGTWPTPRQIDEFAEVCATTPVDPQFVEHDCGSVRILSSPMPQDREFAFSIAFEPPPEWNGEVAVKWLTPATDGA